MYRFKVEIIIDEEKVVKDQLYNPKKMYKYIRDMFRQYHLKEVQTETPNHIIFVDRGTNKDMAGLACAAIDLSEIDWFRKYTDEFYWYEPNKFGEIVRINAFDEIASV